MSYQKLQEMFNEESGSDDMVCVKSVKTDINWKAWTWGDGDRGVATQHAAQGGHWMVNFLIHVFVTKAMKSIRKVIVGMQIILVLKLF